MQKVGFVKYKSGLLHGHKMRNNVNIICTWAINTRNITCSTITLYKIKCVNGKIAEWAEEGCDEVPEEDADARTMIQYTLKIVSFTVRAV